MSFDILRSACYIWNMAAQVNVSPDAVREQPKRSPERTKSPTDARLLDFYAHRLLGLFHILSDGHSTPDAAETSPQETTHGPT